MYLIVCISEKQQYRVIKKQYNTEDAAMSDLILLADDAQSTYIIVKEQHKYQLCNKQLLTEIP